MDPRAKRVQKKLDIPVLIAALAVIPVLVLEQANLAGIWNILAEIGNWMIWLVFLAELIIMLIVVEDKWRYLRTHLLEVAIIILSPPVAPAALQSTRLFRLLRLTRLLRAPQIINALYSIEGLKFAALVLFFVVISGGYAFTTVEKSQALSVWDGIYWAVTTVTTVGSTVQPQTDAGRVISLVILFAGTGFVAILTAAFAERFVSSQKRSKEQLADEVKILKKLDEIAKRLNRLERK